jgi:UDP-N-acetylmuramoyl-tripeptide--D-alanyl-D-alanine ligase
MKKIFSKLVLKYLQFLTKHYIKRHDIDIIGLTGSVGKTTLTLAIHKILSTKYKTAMTFKDGLGLNSETGIPFAILDVHVKGYSPLDWIRYLLQAGWNFLFKKCEYEKFVVEMGVDKPDDMEFLLSMIQPSTGVFLSIGKVHGENFEELLQKRGKGALIDLIFEEKAKMIKSLPKDGFAILNTDDEMIVKLKGKTKAKVIMFGLSKEAEVRGKILDISKNGFEGEISYKSRRSSLVADRYIINKGTFTTLLAAVAVGGVYNISLDDCTKALESMDFPPGRMTLIEGIKNTIIIDSSYSSSKPALLEALDNLAIFKDRKRIVVLGDMRELGKETESEHKEVARKAVQVADEMVLIGPAMRDYFQKEAVKQGFAQEKIRYFDNTWKALEFLKERLKGFKDGTLNPRMGKDLKRQQGFRSACPPSRGGSRRGDLNQQGPVIFVKGSQNTLFLEIIVEGLMKDKSKADELLCRRGEFWDKKREELKNA